MAHTVATGTGGRAAAMDRMKRRRNKAAALIAEAATRAEVPGG
jgi:hypothetical protein